MNKMDNIIVNKEIVIEKPMQGNWDETFAWGKKFARQKKIKFKDVLKAIGEIRLPK